MNRSIWLSVGAVGIMVGVFACATGPKVRTPASFPRDNPSEYFVDDHAKCTSFSKTISAEQVGVIGNMMNSHEHRLNHMLWHATRNSWSELSANEKRIITDIDSEWGKNAPVCPPPAMVDDTKPISPWSNVDASGVKAAISPSGEEFLLMHHGMVDMLRFHLMAADLPCIEGWETLPKADDADFPVPPGASDDTSKSDAMGTRMDAWAKKIHDPEFLRGKSLSFVGYLVENTIHNNMHMRWAAKPRDGDDFSPLDATGSALTKVSLLTPSKEYDVPSRNWLGNPYSAHVNPVFWKLHGWVDDTIPLWLKANGYEVISKNCHGLAKCYQWKSTWIGATGMRTKAPAPGDSNHPKKPGNDAEIEAVLKKISKHAGFRNVKLDRESRIPRAGAKGMGDANAPDPLADPVAYLNKYGPCSP